NKLLHNRVCNDIGVFEGNGGDLQIGLAWQSVHDGEQLMHRPVRLQVVIEASEDAINTALGQAEDFNQLYKNHWINVLRLNERGELCPLNNH
ncbi:MAG: putative inorganic carbon transporter subunit DabA, partial [Pseudomonadota bacterium]